MRPLVLSRGLEANAPMVVQTAVLPLLLSNGRALYAPFDPPCDLCVSAPTGSGKTLSYVVPIVEVRHSPAHLTKPTTDEACRR